MDNQQAGSNERSIPAFQLTVLQQIILVTVPFIIYDIALTAILQRVHILNIHIRVFKYNGLQPSGNPTLVTGIACGLIAVTIIASAIHQVPRSHTLTTTVVNIVEVRVT